jgi:hypothetical protein
MIRQKARLLAAVGLAAVLMPISQTGCRTEQNRAPGPSGPYFGQTAPSETPALFAPGIVSTGLDELGIAFMPDGRECYWTVLFSGLETILMSREENGRWTEPEVAPFSGKYYDGWPAIRPDGRRLFFHSARPRPDRPSGEEGRFGIWYMDRTGAGWSEPRILESLINEGGNATCPSVTKDGTIYVSKRFADNSEKLSRSKFVDGKYQAMEILPAIINTTDANFHGVIAPDESYLIRPLNGRTDAIGGGWNYYVSFRSSDDRWSELINLGKGVHAVNCSALPTISADGKYLFLRAWIPSKERYALDRRLTWNEFTDREIRESFGNNNDIYWIATKFIEALKSIGDASLNSRLTPQLRPMVNSS